MPNPLFNDASMSRAAEAAGVNWGAPETGDRRLGPLGGPAGGETAMTDGPISPWTSPGRPTDTMSPGGTMTAALVLFTLLLISATVGWMSSPGTEVRPDGSMGFSFPMLAWVGLIVGLVTVFAMAFRPKLARILAPVYAIAQGFFVGAISKAYESFYDGIVVQAAGATLATFFVMLVLYRTRIIKVTDRFRRTVIGATLGVLVLYGVSLLMSLFGSTPSFLTSPSLLGIGISVVICVIAALNLALDFDLIERGTAEGMPKYFEWYAAFSLMVTMIWLYLEFLRLFAKARN